MRTELNTEGTVVLERQRVLDYIALTKPELTFLSVLTALAGFALGSGGSMNPLGLIHILIGTALVGGGAGALNQFIERGYDAMMKRTENRPLPSGRLNPAEALIFGIAISAVGIAEMTLFLNPLTGILAGMTLLMYLFLYTPLKRITPVSTLVGAIPGAIPPVMGWTAARNELSPGAAVLFGILFFWQMPHFLSLAWMYRKDYARAGYRMLTVVDRSGKITGWNVVIYSVLLLATSLAPTVLGETGLLYGIPAFLLGAAFLMMSWRFLRERSTVSARQLFIGSLLYLPTLVAAMVITRF